MSPAGAPRTTDTVPDLTICTVAFESEPFLKLNWRLTQALNPATELRWLIQENSPWTSPLRLHADDENFMVAQGAIEQQAPSLHHALGMNRLIRRVHTRFALVLDPDFFVVRPDWIRVALAHMRRARLSFFGVPWHPRWFLKWRYFPCAHCLFIDLDRVGKQKLDFRPELEIEKRADPKGLLGHLMAKYFAHRRPIWWALRRQVGADSDTGYHLYRSFHGRPEAKSQCIPAVFRPHEAFRPRQDYMGRIPRLGFFASRTNALFEKLLPEKFCALPKKVGYVSRKGFREMGAFDASANDWEEFVWDRAPFGFHLRCMPGVLEDRDKFAHMRALEEAVRFFVKRGLASSPDLKRGYRSRRRGNERMSKPSLSSSKRPRST